MGAWGRRTFDNDNALEWAADFAEQGDLSFVKQTLERAITAGDKLDTTCACHALAACEVVARLKGNWGPQNALSANVDNWVLAHPGQPSAVLVARAGRDRSHSVPAVHADGAMGRRRGQWDKCGMARGDGRSSCTRGRMKGACK